MAKFYRIENDAEIAPCIVSKAKYALGKKRHIPDNNKPCSYKYWCEAVDILANYYGTIDPGIVAAAKNKYTLLFLLPRR